MDIGLGLDLTPPGTLPLSESNEGKESSEAIPSNEPVTGNHTNVSDEALRSGRVGCRRLHDVYETLNKISEGTYGAVMRARHRKTGKIVALKKLKYLPMFWKDGCPPIYLREIYSLLHLQHPNLTNVEEVMIGSAPKEVYLVMEYVEHELKVLLQRGKPEFSIGEKKTIIKQIAEGLSHMHSNFIMHRDLKTSNLLYSNQGLVKLCDFGMARRFGNPARPYTANTCTLWYRAPELMLGARVYDEGVDVWAFGCVMAEIILGEPIFTGSTELEVLTAIFKLTGTPTTDSWPEFSVLPLVLAKPVPLTTQRYDPSWRKKFQPVGSGSNLLSNVGMNLLKRLLEPNPLRRISIHDALKDPYFLSDRPLPVAAVLMPTIPETNATTRKHVKTSPLEGRVDRRLYLAELERENKRQKTASDNAPQRRLEHRDDRTDLRITDAVMR